VLVAHCHLRQPRHRDAARGAWAYPAILVDPPSWANIGPETSIAVSGADGSLQACGFACEALVDLGGSLVEVDSLLYGEAAMLAFTPLMQTTIDAIRVG
jgi:hypothetical protein